MPAWNPLSLHVGRIAPFITQRRWRQEESIHFCILTPGYSTLLRWSNHHIRQHSSAPGAWRIYFFCTILARNPWHLIQPIRNPSTFDCYLHLVVVHPYILLGWITTFVKLWGDQLLHLTFVMTWHLVSFRTRNAVGLHLALLYLAAEGVSQECSFACVMISSQLSRLTELVATCRMSEYKQVYHSISNLLVVNWKWIFLNSNFFGNVYNNGCILLWSVGCGSWSVYWGVVGSFGANFALKFEKLNWLHGIQTSVWLCPSINPYLHSIFEDRCMCYTWWKMYVKCVSQACTNINNSNSYMRFKK